jgi:hypothetical protein
LSLLGTASVAAEHPRCLLGLHATSKPATIINVQMDNRDPTRSLLQDLLSPVASGSAKPPAAGTADADRQLTDRLAAEKPQLQVLIDIAQRPISCDHAQRAHDM